MSVLPLMSEPTPFSGKNLMSALQSVEFVDQCIDEVLKSSCIRELDATPQIGSPLSEVESNSGKEETGDQPASFEHVPLYAKV